MFRVYGFRGVGFRGFGFSGAKALYCKRSSGLVVCLPDMKRLG